MIVGRVVAQNAQFEFTIQELRWNFARFRAAYLDLYFREQAAILLDMWDKIQSCCFIGSN